MAFTTHVNHNDKYVTIHRSECGQKEKHGGIHFDDKGEYKEFSTYNDALSYAVSLNLPFNNCSICIPEVKDISENLFKEKVKEESFTKANITLIVILLLMAFFYFVTHFDSTKHKQTNVGYKNNSKRVSLNPQMDSILGSAIRNRNLSGVQTAIENGANVNYIIEEGFLTKKTPLCMATENRDIEIVKILLANGAIINDSTFGIQH